MILLLSVVLKTSKLLMLPFVIVVVSVVLFNATRGIKIPLSEATISNCDDLFGVNVPIPT